MVDTLRPPQARRDQTPYSPDSSDCRSVGRIIVPFVCCRGCRPCPLGPFLLLLLLINIIPIQPAQGRQRVPALDAAQVVVQPHEQPIDLQGGIRES